jgi:hypothetical protein
MRPHPKLRAIVYPLILLPTFTVIFLALALCLRNGEVPARLVNSKVLQSFAARAGIQHRVQSLDVGCFQPDCGSALDAGGVELHWLAAESASVVIDSLHWCSAHPLSLRGLRLRTPDNSNLQVGALDFSVSSRETQIRDIRVTSSNLSATVQSVSLSPLIASNQTGLLRFDSINVSGTDLQLSDSSTHPNLCQQTRVMLSAGNDAANTVKSALERINGVVSRIRRGLFFVSLIVPAILFLLKVWSLAWTQPWRVRLGLACACIAVPLLVYVFAAQHVTLRRLLMITAAACVSLAGGLWFGFYRRGTQWYQRLEPVVVDVACVVIVLPIAAYNFDLGGPLRPVTRFEVGQINVADLSIKGSQEQCRSPRLFEAAVRLASVDDLKVGLPDASQESSFLGLGRIEIPTLVANVRDERNPRVDLIRVSAGPVTADNIAVALDWKNQQLRDLQAGLHLRGRLDTSGSLEEFRKIPALQPLLRTSRDLDFAIELEARGPASGRTLNPDFVNLKDVQSTVALQAKIAIDPQRCDLQYAWATRVLTPPIRLVASGIGSSDSVEIGNVHTLPGSAVHIDRGAGSVSLAKDVPVKLQLAGLRAGLQGTEVQAASAEVSASSTPSCAPIHQAFAMNINDVRVKQPSGSTLHIEQSTVQLNRNAGARTTPVSLLAAVTNARLASSESRIDVNVASIKVAVNGTATLERFPRRFDGGVAFSVGTSRDVMLENAAPLNVLADLWNGTLDVPNQQQILRQYIFPNIPNELFVSMSMHSAARSFNARAFLPGLPIRLSPIETELRDLEAHIRREADETTPQVTYKTGWNRVSLPSLLPKQFCFDTLSEFDLVAEGGVKGLVLPRVSSSHLPSMNPCTDLPSVPSENLFRIEGVWPSLRLDGLSGLGVQIPDISGTEIQTLDLRDGRLSALELDSRVANIRPLVGEGELGARTHIAVSGNSSKITSSFLGAGGASLADFTVEGPLQRPEITIAPRAGLDEIIRNVRPFLPSGATSVAGLTPRARIERVHAGLEFEQSKVAAWNAQIDVARGPLASLTPATDSVLRRLEVSLEERGSVALDAQRGAFKVNVDMPRLALQAANSNGAELQTTVGIKAGLHGTLGVGESSSNPILDRASTTLNNVAQHLNKAVQVFGDSAAPSEPTDLAWKFRVKNSRDGEEPLRLTSGQVGIRLAADVEKFVWRSGSSETSSLAGSAEFNGDLRAYEGQLVLDANVPIRLSASTASQPARTIAANMPLLVAISDRLKPSRANSAGLWDSDYYRNFWAGYRVEQAARGAAALVDTSRLTFGPLSIRQLRLPVEPLHVALGVSDRFEIYLPFGGRALFGSADGVLEGAVEWRPDRALVNSNLSMTLRNLQAGALGLDSEYGHSAFLEDEVDGDIWLGAHDWVWSRAVLDRFAAARLPSLEQVSMSLNLRKSERSKPIPGVLQLSSDTRVNTLNVLLNRIIRNLQMASPPQQVQYKNFLLDLRVDRGKVSTASPWLTLEGARIFTSPLLDLDGNVRVHGPRNGEELELQNLVDTLVHE